jgi:protocatechuate 3,4-dioxygenase, alpha subunit
VSRSTPSQTVGPYLAIGMPWDDGPVADPDGVRVEGVVYDGAGEPIPDALVETWTEGAFARCATDDEGRWHVVMPAASYWAVHVFARGLLRHLTTRICFDEAAIPEGVPAERRETLMVRDGRFDIRIQGAGETAFFDL